MLRATRLVLVTLIVCVACQTLTAGADQDRRAAIDRALGFLFTTASNEQYFARYGSDILWCFYSISHTSRDRHLRSTAGRMGSELAQRWRQTHGHVPANESAIGIYNLVQGSYAAERLGFPDPRLKNELRLAAGRFGVTDYLRFDAAHGAPSPDDPERYDKFTDALIRSYFGDAYGITMGAHYHDVVRWLPSMRPYEGHDEDMEFDAFYTVSHAIYTLNHYHELRISPALLPQEFGFLRRKLSEAIADDDPEMVGEALDCLKAAGVKDDPQVKQGIAYLLLSQRSDGSWAGDDGDVYTAYHSAWTGVDALRDYRYRGELKAVPWR